MKLLILEAFSPLERGSRDIFNFIYYFVFNKYGGNISRRILSNSFILTSKEEDHIDKFFYSRSNSFYINIYSEEE
jgi:hypothetical protein